MKRRVLFFTCELPPLPGLPVTGGGLRVHGLAEGLRAAGHEVVLSVPRAKLAAAGEAADALAATAHDPQDLGPLIVEVRPDILLFEQWGTATYLPEVDLPVVLDLHGPLALENANRSGGNVTSDAFTKIETLAKADLLTCPGIYQRNYFLGWWVLAGADPRTARVEVVPVCLSPELPKRRKHAPLRFVFAGTAWPWIDPFPGLSILAEAVAKRDGAALDLFVGRPNVALAGGNEEAEHARYRELVERLSGLRGVTLREPIGRDDLLKEYLTASCAFDVYRRNPERELAVTTRTVEYLWSGLPVIYGDYGELAPLIERYGAGIVVNPEDERAIQKAVLRVMEEPDLLDEMSRNARRLARERFAWDRAVTPLAEFVQRPTRRESKRSVLSGFKAVMDAHWEGLHLAKVQRLEDAHRTEVRDLLARIDALHDRLQDEARRRDDELRAQREEAREALRSKEATIERLLAEKEAEVARRDAEIRALSARIDDLNRSYSDKLWQLGKEKEELQRAKEEELRRLREEWQAVVSRRDETIRELDARLARQAEEMNQRLWAVTEQAKSDAKEAERQLEKLRDQAREELARRDEHLARLEAKFADTDRDYQTQLRQLADERREQMRAKDEELRLLRESKDREMAQRDEEIRRLRDERAREIARRDETIAELGRRIDEVQRTWEQRQIQFNAERAEQLAAKDREIEKAWSDRHREVELRDRQIEKLQDLLREQQRDRAQIDERLREKAAEAERAASDVARLAKELADTRAWAEKLEEESRARLGALEQALRDQEKAFGESEANFRQMESTIIQQRDHIAHLGREIARIQGEADAKIRMLEREREDRDRMLGQLDHVRRDLEARDRALQMQMTQYQSRTRQKIRRKARKLLKLYPRLAWLFMVNLLTNLYMEKWQKRHGKQIFPGHVKVGS